MLIEAVRLVVTLAFTALGFVVGDELPRQGVVGSDPDLTVILGAVLGAGVGYVTGGLLGRLFRRLLDASPRVTEHASGPQLFAGAFGLLTGVLVGSVAAVPLVVLLHPLAGWPLASLVVIALGAWGSRLFSHRASDLLAAIGIRSVTPDASGVDQYVVDSSAAIDGRFLDLARAGLMRGVIVVAGFVVDELQGIADSGDRNRRRRGRRGLDVLEALSEVPSVTVRSEPRTFPLFEEVDAKLVALTDDLGARLVTTDHNLAKAAALRGIEVLDLQALGDLLKSGPMAGETVRILVERAGTEPGQGIAFLEDGTMVVVEGAAGIVGDEVNVEVTSALRTSVGRMLFARLQE
ncbi:MAG TPA: TRAM domain-containing protein [Acidimicrobiia bacterium]|nr:TRAM domain-containing protein [Acidimicrobiia bacterium]